MLYLGVDGGGTKTAFCLIDEKESVLLEKSYGTCYVAEVGEAGAQKIFQAFEQDMKALGKSYKDIHYTFLGMPGYSEAPEWDKLILKVLKNTFGSRFTCANDCVAGWAGSLACKPGINLVAGTGAIAFGVNQRGESARISGWGSTIGDEGSAYWLGIRALQLFSKQSDGRLPQSPFYQIFKNHLKLGNDQDLIHLVYNEWGGARAKVADLSLTIYEAAVQNDPSALNLIEQTAEECFLMARGLAEKLSLPEGFAVSYSGGVFNMGSLLLEPLAAKLNTLGAALRPPALSPVRGAALYALRLAEGSGGNRAATII